MSLTSCALDVVCSVYNSPDKDIMVYNNGTFCQSVEVIDSICNPACGMVDNLNGSGVGSLKYNLECIAPNDTIFIDSALAYDTIYLTESIIDISKSFVLSGPENRVCISTTLNYPLLVNHQNQNIHLLNVNLMHSISSIETMVVNDGTLILEDCDLSMSNSQFIQNESGQLLIKGNVRMEE